jgi:hypothetical protein
VLFNQVEHQLRVVITRLHTAGWHLTFALRVRNQQNSIFQDAAVFMLFGAFHRD